jgi:hypothetical protein
MKTAMQELLKHFIDEWSSPSDLWNPSKIIDKVESMIEKEKEQIEIAFDLGRDEVTSVFIIDGEDYYNKSYNQNKKETLEEWKAKFTHHCAIKPKNK